jgi:hypothetical protein
MPIGSPIGDDVTSADGASRRVYLIGNFAIKTPLPGREGSGRAANLSEAQIWATEKRDRLCPVLFCDPTGDLLVMPRARMVTREEFEGFDISTLLGPYAPGTKADVEYKAASFGYLGERLVVVDYAEPPSLSDGS